MAAVFITNGMLEQWSDQGKVRLEDTTLTLLQEHRTVKLKPAVRFTKLIDGGADPNNLLGKVKTPEQLHEMGAEHYLDSVILGDVGYQVVEGFLGDLSPPKGSKGTTPPVTSAPSTVPSTLPSTLPMAAASRPPSAACPPTPPSGTKPGKSEAEELSSLFLKTVKD